MERIIWLKNRCCVWNFLDILKHKWGRGTDRETDTDRVEGEKRGVRGKNVRQRQKLRRLLEDEIIA